jgi:hypothetical protein
MTRALSSTEDTETNEDRDAFFAVVAMAVPEPAGLNSCRD